MREWNRGNPGGRSRSGLIVLFEAGFWVLCALLGVLGAIAVLL